MLRLISIAAIASCAYAQTASITGVVTSSITGSPLPRVHVVLRNPTDNSGALYGAETTDDGRFSITGVAATRDYILSGARVGYATGRLSLTLQRDETRNIFELKLVPTGAITGRITDSRGDPVEHLRVTAEGPDRKESSTDENGQFRIGGLAPGKYRVKASSSESFMTKPEILADGSLQLRNAPTWYPGVLESRQAQRVEVRPDSETTGADIQLVGVPNVRVSGKVFGMPPGVAQEYVTLSSSGIGGGFGDPIKPDGTFQFWGVDPGKYSLSASWGGFAESGGSSGLIHIEVAGSNVDNIELRILPPVNLAGRLSMETADSPPPNTQTRVTLRDFGSASNPGDPATVTTDDTFTLTNVRAGKYVVSVSRDGFYVKSTRLGTTESDGDVVDLTTASGATDLTLTLSPAAGSISGTVHDANDKPVDALVILSRDRGEETLFVTQSIDAQPDGSYSFTHLPPGEYKVAAFPREDAEMVLKPYALAEFDDLMESVDLAPDGKVSLDLYTH